jgi:hypothetical protein
MSFTGKPINFLCAITYIFHFSFHQIYVWIFINFGNSYFESYEELGGLPIMKIVKEFVPSSL